MDAKVYEVKYSSSSETSFEEFLLNEGMELLANYKSIQDVAVRRAIRDMMVLLGKSGDPIH